jgi:hypothetical protein
MKQKVRVIVRSDDITSLKQFDEACKPKWFYMPKGDDIRIIEGTVYFDHVAEDVAIETKKVIVIGYTPEITMVGLIPEERLSEFPRAIKVKECRLKV